MQLEAIEQSGQAEGSKQTGDDELVLFGKLMRARVSFMMDKCLESSVSHLKDVSLELYDEYLQAVRLVPGNKRVEQLLLAEQSYCLLHFYRYEDASAAVKTALSLANLDLHLTGRLGKRTLY